MKNQLFNCVFKGRALELRTVRTTVAQQVSDLSCPHFGSFPICPGRTTFQGADHIRNGEGIHRHFGLIGADTSGMVSQEFMLLRLIAILINLLIIQRRELKLRAQSGDIIIRPRCANELPSSVPFMSLHDRQLRDLQSARNCSDETAKQILGEHK
jgi:hypothetical protein